MRTKFIPLDHIRIPGYPDARLSLDHAPLCVVDHEGFSENTGTSDLTAAIGVATVLFRWCPDALYAFLDLDAWFSFTWSVTVQQGEPDEMKIEIGRIRNQVTMGTLDKDGAEWQLMVTYNMSLSGPDRGAWIPNPDESMLDGRDINDPQEVDRLGRGFIRDLLLKQRWSTERKIRHQLFIEYAPMEDVFDDGIAMNPHWLYKSLDLSQCTTCGNKAGPNISLSRCGRCGTATYCSATCQRSDWPVHKAVCNMHLEERGKALHLTQNGGLINWDRARTLADDGETISENPNFIEPQRKLRSTLVTST